MRNGRPVPWCLFALTMASGAAGPATVPTTAPAGPPGDRRTFTLSAVPPTVPALRYALAVDPADRLPGNAAVAYLEAGLQVSVDDSKAIDDASDAVDVDWPKFDRIVAGRFAGRGGAVQALADASRCDGCDWGFPSGPALAGPWASHLNAVRNMANLLRYRAMYEARAGHVDEAVGSLRWGYELGRRLGEGDTLIQGLVSAGIIAAMADPLQMLMNRVGGPNLYWPLANLGRPGTDVARALNGERRFTVAAAPVLAKGRTGDITAGDWSAYRTAAAAYVRSTAISGPGQPATFSPDADWTGDDAAAAASLLPRAAAHYAATRHVPVDSASRLDPRLLAATYCIEQYQVASDAAYAWAPLPYPKLIPAMRAIPDRLRDMGLTAPDPFLILFVRRPGHIVQAFARCDRTLAAFTAVEAIRSYAAGHAGQLPASLADVADTPVPDNPVTGRPFEWRVDDGVGTLGDHDALLADRPLEYTVCVRRP